jgi:hypothetical protein
MSKTKAEEKPTIEAEHPPPIEGKKDSPEKQGGPVKIARAALQLASNDSGSGGSQRAQANRTMQGAMGNARMGEMLAANQSGAAPTQTIQRQAKDKSSPGSSTAGGADTRQDVVVIVGRPSMTIASKETQEEKEQMQTWRAAGRALSPDVLEGLTVDEAFTKLRKLKKPIGKLYIIGHADPSGIGEVNKKGESVSTTLEDLTARMKKATGALGANRPESVEMLSCFGGSEPKMMGRIGETLGAQQVRAPVQMTVVSGKNFKMKGKLLTAADMRKEKKEVLLKWIEQSKALQHYDYVAGVPHPDPPPSKAQKLDAMVGIMRQTGMIPFISYNSEPGERDAVPYWKAPIEKRKKTENLSDDEQLSNKGLIEVDVQEPEKKP